MNKRIYQTGLWSDDPQDVKDLIHRVDQFNLYNIGNAIKLDVMPYTEGDEFVPRPHYKFRFEYPSKDIQIRFWKT